MKAFYQLRFVLLCICLVLLGLFVLGGSLRTRIVHAIVGTLNMGNNTTSTTYVKNNSVYQGNLTFGTGGSAGILYSNGNVGIGTIGDATLGPANRLQVVGGTTSLGGATTITTGGLTVAAGGASITGGLNNNAGGLTNTGALSGATDITLSGAISGGTTYTGSGNITSTGGIVSTSGTGTNYFAGTVGIGTTAPGQKLSVAGVIESTTGGFKFPDGTISTSATPLFSGTANYMVKFATASTLGNSQVFDNGTNVGIGSSVPTAKLDVAGTNSTISNTSGNLTIIPAVNLLISQGNIGIGSAVPAAKLDISGVTSTIANSAGNMSIIPAANLLITQGNVGIGTATPGFKLDVGGIINATALYVGGAPYVGSQWTTSSPNIYFNTGNVGIGTTGPQTALTISKANVAYAGQLQIGANDFSQITFYNSGALTPSAANRKAHIYSNLSDNTFQIANDITNAPLVLQGPDSGGGNVGIGSTSPTQKLDVNGIIKSNNPWFIASDNRGWVSGNGWTNVNYNTVLAGNAGGWYNTSTGNFTAPVSGAYLCTSQHYIYTAVSGAPYIHHLIACNGAWDSCNGYASYTIFAQNGTTYAGSTTTTQIVFLNAGEYVRVNVYVSSGTYNYMYGAYSRFSCFLVNPT